MTIPVTDFVCAVRQQDILPVRVSFLVLLEDCLQFRVVVAGRAGLGHRALHRCPDVAEVGFGLAVEWKEVDSAERLRVVPYNRTLLGKFVPSSVSPSYSLTSVA